MHVTDWRKWMDALMDAGGIKAGEVLVVMDGVPQVLISDGTHDANGLVGPVISPTVIKGWLIDKGYWR